LAPTPNPSPSIDASRTRRQRRGWSEWSLVSAVCGRTSKKGRVSFGLKVGSESIEPSPCATSGFDGLWLVAGARQPGSSIFVEYLSVGFGCLGGMCVRCKQIQ
jgi:hypothetical protein